MRVLVLTLIVVLFSGVAEARGKSKCKKGERFVRDGTAVLGGPALGFDTVDVVDKTACFTVMRTTEDGAFALILLEKQKVGWVSLGLVDARLSEDKDAKAAPLEAEQKAFVSTATPLRETPRFDGPVRVVVKAGAELTLTGRSPDGLWRYAKDGKNEGWLPRYALTDTPIEAGTEPSAGEGEWSVRKVDRNRGGLSEQKDDKKPVPVAPVDVKRTQEIWGQVHPLVRWSQRYISDAQNDPLFKYDIQSISGGLGGGYSYRDDEVPVVADVRLDFDVFRFDVLPPGGINVQGVSVIYVDTSARGGYPVLRSDEVDLEAGIGGGLTTFLIDDLLDANGAVTKAFTSALYFDLRPYAAARARVAGGRLGFVSAEASLGIGGYFMLNDPANLNPADIANLDVGRAPILEPAPVDVVPPAPPELAGPVNLSVGVDLVVRYSYPIAADMTLDIGGSFKARQALIAGPGKRFLGIYTEATNLDVIAGVTTGLTFSGLSRKK